MVKELIKNSLSKDKLVLTIVIIALLSRILIVFTMGLMPQDAYYYYYSTNPDWSYFDHPPMVAYMLWLFTHVFGKSVINIKLASFITSFLTLIVSFQFLRNFLPRNRAFLTTIMLGVSVLFTVLSMNATPDVPLMLFWAVSLLFLHKAVFKGCTHYWLLAGLAMGLAFDSKYTGLLLPVGLILFLLISKEHRKYLLSFKLVSALLVFIVTIAPVFYWNYSYDWMSFTFQSSRRAGSIMEMNPRFDLFLGNIGTQMGLLTPVLFVLIMSALGAFIWRHLKLKSLPKANQLFLLCFALPTLGGFMFISLFYWVKLNWMMPGYISGIVFVGYCFRKKAIKAHYIIAGIFNALLLIEIIFYLVPIKSDDTWVGWEELAQGVNELRNEYPEDFIFAFDDYKTSALLNYYLDETVYAGNVIGGNALQFNITQSDLSHLKGKNALFIDSDKRLKNTEKYNEIDPELNDYFEKVEELEPIIVYLRDKPIRKWFVFRCYNYTGGKK